MYCCRLLQMCLISACFIMSWSVIGTQAVGSISSLFNITSTVTTAPSIYDKDSITQFYKIFAPVLVTFFTGGSISQQCFGIIGAAADPWLQAFLTFFFSLVDTNHDGVLTPADTSPLGIFIVFIDFLIMGADTGNDYSISLAEFTAFLNVAPFQPNDVYKNALLVMFSALDHDHDQKLSFFDIVPVNILG
uniref:EF-hand domain-containing protein n=1 Tax=Biomphalaria glabrata TaxID=6526 RepID=A0A2C9LMQ7_BIOGL